jgi:hypothetical protein
MTVEMVRPSAALLDKNCNANLEVPELGPALARAMETTRPIPVEDLHTRIESGWNQASQIARTKASSAGTELQKNLAVQKSANESLSILSKIVQGGVTASIVGIFVGLLAGTAGLAVVCVGLAAAFGGTLIAAVKKRALREAQSQEPEVRRAYQATLVSLVAENRQARTTAHVHLSAP